MPPGTVQISPARQQLIGLRSGTVEKISGSRTVRVLGRVAVDETRIYRLNSAVDGWIRDISPNTVGSLIAKDQSLISYYAPEFTSAQQAYFYALSSMEHFEAANNQNPAQITNIKANIELAEDNLRNLGMGDIQIHELRKSRETTPKVILRSPVTGFIIFRNVSPGQRFERGTEFYRVADLSHLWVVADIFESDSRHFHPGAHATVKYGALQRTFIATVSDILPQFDPATRTLKLRLEAENPDFALRPDMFVDVEIPVQIASTLAAPSDAVIDTGLRKVVFVDHGNGFFEPRRVETGWRMDGRVEVTKGLVEGERIVISGTFLVDSESRLQLAAAGLPEDYADRSCLRHGCGCTESRDQKKRL